MYFVGFFLLLWGWEIFVFHILLGWIFHEGEMFFFCFGVVGSHFWCLWRCFEKLFSSFLFFRGEKRSLEPLRFRCVWTKRNIPIAKWCEFANLTRWASEFGKKCIHFGRFFFWGGKRKYISRGKRRGPRLKIFFFFEVTRGGEGLDWPEKTPKRFPVVHYKDLYSLVRRIRASLNRNVMKNAGGSGDCPRCLRRWGFETPGFRGAAEVHLAFLRLGCHLTFSKGTISYRIF